MRCMSGKRNEMLVAVRSGVTFNWDGAPKEITAGQTRIAPELLDERPQFAEFFERDVSVRGTDASAMRVRTTLPNGRIVEG